MTKNSHESIVLTRGGDQIRSFDKRCEMKKVLMFLSLLGFVGCATAGGVASVKVGDKLKVTVKDYDDCELAVANIITMAPTRNGIEKLPEAMFCGYAYCPKSAPDRAPEPACLPASVFWKTAK